MGSRNGILYSDGFDFSGTNAVTGNTMTTNGQLLIGRTGGLPVINTLTAGVGIGIANAAGAITITNTGVAVVQQGIYYVAKHGNDANNGLSIEFAKLTIQAAVTAAPAGSTILVSPGTYTETITHTASNVCVFGRGDYNDCIIQQANANVINFNTQTELLYKFFTIQCTAATTAINTVQGSTGSCIFKDCYLRMVSATAIVAAVQPSVGAITGAGELAVRLGAVDYFHTGNCGGTAIKSAFLVANGGLVGLDRIIGANVICSGTALATALVVDQASTGNVNCYRSDISVTDPNATIVAGLGYLGGTGLLHEYYRNVVHVTATNNTGYGFYAGDTATASRFFYNHIHVTDVAGSSDSFYIGATATVISHFDDLIAADGYDLDVAGFFTEVSSEVDGQLSVTNLTAKSLVLGGGSGSMTPLGAATHGQIPIGSTGANPVLATITAGAGISVTNAAGAITIASVGAGLAWSTIGASQNLVVGAGVMCTAGAALVLTLPAVAAVGATFEAVLDGSTSWGIAQLAGQQIRIGNVETTAGVGGSITSTAAGDWIQIVCVTANTRFLACAKQGNFTIV